VIFAGNAWGKVKSLQNYAPFMGRKDIISFPFKRGRIQDGVKWSSLQEPT
jgi:hypothetical protein